MNITQDEGDKCRDINCNGILEYEHKGDGCSCFISAPCGYCASSYLVCSKCGKTDEDYNQPIFSGEVSILSLNNWLQSMNIKYTGVIYRAKRGLPLDGI